MAKLIKIDKSQAKRVTHKECGAVIEYFENEVKWETHGYYDGSTDVSGSIKCPNCKQRFTVR